MPGSRRFALDRSRRAALFRAAAALLVVACRRALPGAGGRRNTSSESASQDSGEACSNLAHGTAEEGWIAIDLSLWPDLLEPGGQAAIDVDEALLHVLVVHDPPGCYLALWRICSHGACDVAWDGEAGEVVCPCHGSRFDAAGGVLRGPATEDLDTFPVVRDGDRLWIHRPR